MFILEKCNHIWFQYTRVFSSMWSDTYYLYLEVRKTYLINRFFCALLQ